MDREKNTAVGAAVLALVIFTAVITFVKIWEPDTWWHLQAGRVITETNQLPDTDLFSHSMPDAKWINDEWLGDYFLYSIYEKSDITGLQVLVSLMAALIIFIVYQSGRILGADPLFLIPLAGVAAIAARIRMTPRPELFSIFFIVSVFYILNRILAPKRKDFSDEEYDGLSEDRRQGKFIVSRVEFILLPLIQMLWVNSHPGAPMGIVIISTAIFGAMAAFLINSQVGASFTPEVRAQTLRRLGLMFIFTILATLANPYGLHGLLAPMDFSTNRVFLKHIAEWAPVPVREMFSFSHGSPGAFALPVMAAALFFSFLTGLKRLNLFHLAIVLLTGYMAFTSRRFIPMFAMIATPIAAAHFTPVLSPFLKKQSIRSAIGSLFVILFIVGAIYLGPAHKQFKWGAGINSRFYPEQAINFVKHSDFTGPMYNTYGLGGPLIWGLYPDHKVFVDGRVTLYGSEFYQDVIDFDAAPSMAAWLELKKEYKFTFAVIKTDRIAISKLIENDRSDGKWELVYWDNYIMIYAAPIPEHEKLIEKNAYKLTSPFNVLDLAAAWEKMEEPQKKLFASEIARALFYNPENMQAILSSVLILFKEGDYQRAEMLAHNGLTIDPGQARLHMVIGEIHLMNEARHLAIKEFREAAKINPAFKERLKQVQESGR